MRSSLKKAVMAVTSACLCAAAFPTMAQSYPVKPIRMLMPIPAGSLTDVVGRALATSLGPVFGVPIPAENRAGANGTIGMAQCAKAAPDGYTICMTDGNIMTVNYHAYGNLSYDPKAFVPVAHLADLEVSFVVQSTLPIHNLKELIAYCKQRPGIFKWGSFGSGSTPHMYLEWFQAKTGISVNHIPYKGPAQLQLAMVAGEIDATNMGPANIERYQAQGKVRMIAVAAGKKRSRFLGNTPSFQQQGFDIDFRNWLAIVFPPKTPTELAQRWNTEINKLLNDPAWVSKIMEPAALAPTGGSIEDFKRILAEKTILGEQLAKIANLRPR